MNVCSLGVCIRRSLFSYEKSINLSSTSALHTSSDSQRVCVWMFHPIHRNSFYFSDQCVSGLMCVSWVSWQQGETRLCHCSRVVSSIMCTKQFDIFMLTPSYLISPQTVKLSLFIEVTLKKLEFQGFKPSKSLSYRFYQKYSCSLNIFTFCHFKNIK